MHEPNGQPQRCPHCVVETDTKGKITHPALRAQPHQKAGEAVICDIRPNPDNPDEQVAVCPVCESGFVVKKG